MARTVKTNALKHGDTFEVEGIVHFSRITRRLEGEALAKDIAYRKNMGWPTINDPYCNLEITQAKVHIKNPSAPTPLEIYAMESLYATGQDGFKFNAINKGKMTKNGTMTDMPWCVELLPDGSVKQFIPMDELDRGLRVKVIMRIYAASPNNGVAFDGVIVMEPVRYRTSAQVQSSLAALGYNFIPLTAEEKEQQMAMINHRRESERIPYEHQTESVMGSTQVASNTFTSIPQNMAQAVLNNGTSIYPSADTNVVQDIASQYPSTPQFPTYYPDAPQSNIAPATPGIQPVIQR